MKHSLKWFENRIGRVIYRDYNNCNCADCDITLENGLIIHDKNHSYWLHSVQNDYGAEGIDLNYRDKKETTK